MSILFGSFKMHGGIAMFANFVQAEGLIKMRFSDAGINFRSHAKMLQSLLEITFVIMHNSFFIVFVSLRIGTLNHGETHRHFFRKYQHRKG